VRRSYETTFGFWSELTVTQKDAPHVHISGDVAWTSGITGAAGRPKVGEPIAGVLNFEASVLERRADRWLLVSRSVWRVPQ
jgi:ketosteroid isomerase-like protein